MKTFASGQLGSRRATGSTQLLTALKAAREAAGLTQQQVATKLKTYATFVSKAESGERRLDVVELAELCDVYGCDLFQLLREVGVVG